MTTPSQFHFSKEQTDELRAAIQGYFLDELDLEIGTLQADLFIAFLNEKIGKHYYNLGVTDTIAALKDKAEDLVLLMKE
jgi:uncharacterized protein (DUF2164 family)